MAIVDALRNRRLNDELVPEALDNASVKMSHDHSIPPYAPDLSTEGSASEVLKGAAERVSEAIEVGRRPGMPLSILANVTREAPLASVLCAFLLGVAIARRR